LFDAHRRQNRGAEPAPRGLNEIAQGNPRDVKVGGRTAPTVIDRQLRTLAPANSHFAFLPYLEPPSPGATVLLAYDFVCSEPEQNSSHPTDSRHWRTVGTIVFAVRIPAVLRGVDHRQNTQAFTRFAMSEAKQLQRLALECLRLQADCMQLARVARSLNVQSHFVSMAQFWGHDGDRDKTVIKKDHDRD
jgi:hypothetical protein